jgi:hypothetical protein
MMPEFSHLIVIMPDRRRALHAFLKPSDELRRYIPIKNPFVVSKRHHYTAHEKEISFHPSSFDASGFSCFTLRLHFYLKNYA